ncbi:unnamed protein product [Bathycoccus prasinos]
MKYAPPKKQTSANDSNYPKHQHSSANLNSEGKKSAKKLLSARDKSIPTKKQKNKRDTFREEKEEKTHQEERSKYAFTALERKEERNLATTMAERAIATCIEILFLTGLGALIARSLPPPLELDVKKTRKEKKRVVEKAKRKSSRATEEGKGRKE